jgi:cation diffusion facilitator family transporter
MDVSNKPHLKEKLHVALSSVIAAIFLTAIKLIVGIYTGSLGILSEAAHSALDLGAALLTLFAVRMSARPADDEHHYGHGKVEGFSAFIEVLLLLITCAYIIYEAVYRITTKNFTLDVNIYSFGVILLSIIIDFSRSRALYKVAKKTNSQALEADALHFSSDIWGSLVVILGLAAYKFFGIKLADSVAALIVSILVAVISIRLAIRTVGVLMDKAPSHMRETIYSLISNTEGVSKVHRLRVRTSGNMVFTDMVILVHSDLSIEEAHKISNHVEHKIRQAFPNSDVTIHIEPNEDDSIEQQTYRMTVEKILKEHRVMFKGYHKLSITCYNRTHLISVHIELDKNAPLKETHAVCDHLEHDIKDAIPQSTVTIHVEPYRPR